MNEIFDLSGQSAVVIGATGELGGAMAQTLAAAGARVAVLGRNTERGNACVARIEEAGGEAFFVAADARSESELKAARDEILQRFSAVEILVNAAGGNNPAATLKPGEEFSDLPAEAWQSVFSLNLVGGALLPCQVFGEAMLEAGRGSIINIASLSANIPLSRVPAYSAAKAAVLNLTLFLAREWAQRGVRVNAISPGFFPAEQNRALLFNADGTPSARGAAILNHTPMNRFGKPDELAGALLWLASQRASSFVTGQNIVIDGGFSSTTI